MNSAVVYVRVSTEEQGRKYGPAYQEKECRAYAARAGLPVIAVVNDEISGVTAMEDRPGGRQLLQLARDGQIGAVVVWRLDRLARPPDDELSRLLTTIEQLRRWGVDLHDTSNGKIGNDVFQVLRAFWESIMATEERKRIAARSAAGRLEKAERGEWVGAGGAPYGYVQRWKDEKLVLEVDPDAAAVVVQIFRLYGSGQYTLSGLVRWLNESGIPAPRGKTWHYSTIRERILTRRVYLGEFTYSGVLIELPDLAIITEEEWAAVQGRLETNKQRSRRNRKYRYLLSGHFTCSCGHIMRGYASRGGRNRYYGCRYQVALHGECAQPRFRAGDVEKAVWKAVDAFLCNEEELAAAMAALRERQQRDMLPTLERIQAIDAQLADYRRRKQAQIDALGVVGQDGDIVASIQQIKTIEENLARERAGLERRMEQGVMSPADSAEIQRSMLAMRREIKAATFAAKRHVFNLLDLAAVADGERVEVSCKLGRIDSVSIDSSLRSRYAVNQQLVPLTFTVIVPVVSGPAGAFAAA